LPEGLDLAVGDGLLDGLIGQDAGGAVGLRGHVRIRPGKEGFAGTAGHRQ